VVVVICIFATQVAARLAALESALELVLARTAADVTRTAELRGRFEVEVSRAARGAEQERAEEAQEEEKRTRFEAELGAVAVPEEEEKEEEVEVGRAEEKNQEEDK
jgi:hypothetical protein